MEKPMKLNGLLGEARITPTKNVVAGEYGSWRLTYTTGSSGIDVGGGIKVGTDSDSDWGPPQFDDPKAPNFMSVKTSGDTKLKTVAYGGYSGQWVKVTVLGRSLKWGEEIVLVYGDKRFGSPGSRAQTFAEERRYFRVYVDRVGDGKYEEIANPPYVKVVGGTPRSFSVIAPSKVFEGRPFSFVARALDRFGNPSYKYSGIVYFEAEGEVRYLPNRHVFSPEDHGVHEFKNMLVTRPGLYRIIMRSEDMELIGVSNPIYCGDSSDEYSLYWGDLHGQVKLADKLPEYFRFARDVSALDFASHQRNDHEVSKSDWVKTQRVTEEFNKPGKFVVFLGYEWSGTYERGGDHNVYFLESYQPIRRSGHEFIEDKSDSDTDLTHITELYKEFKGKNVLIIPHVGGRPANLKFHDPELEPVIEIHSAHGTFEWFMRRALERGYKVGFVAGSDDYKLRLGGAYPGFDDRRFVRGGLTALYAKELTRESLFEALKARRCYGTTGERLILKLYVDGHFMGEEYVAETPPEISVEVIGTKSIEKIEVFRWLDKVYEYSPPVDDAEASGIIKVTWEGASQEWSYSGVMWDGELFVENGKISWVEFMPLDRPDEAFYQMGEKGFRWHTFTCGDFDGASLKVDGEKAEINVRCRSIPLSSVIVGGDNRICGPIWHSDAAYFHVCVDELSFKPWVVELGPVGRRLTVRRVAEKGCLEVRFKFVDKNFKHGVNAYWVKVLQSDGGMAWSSPVYAYFPGH
jgi:hypothetical protein